MAVVDSKRCTSCGIEKSLTDFRKSKYGMLGRDAACKSCRGAYDKSRANLRRERRKEQGRGDRTSEYAKRKGMTVQEYKEYRRKLLTDQEKRKAKKHNRGKDKVWRDKAPPCYWYGIGRPWANPNLTQAEAFALRYREDEEFRLKQCIRSQLRKQLRGLCWKTENKINACLRNGHSSPSTEEFLGYSIEELRAHLEKQFRKGMTWKNYGNRWHIDHIIPKAQFDPSRLSEVKACWSLPNLRPMLAKENLKKRDKLLYLL